MTHFSLGFVGLAQFLSQVLALDALLVQLLLLLTHLPRQLGLLLARLRKPG